MTIGDKMARGMTGATSSPLETRADTRYIIILSLDLRSDPRAPHTCHMLHTIMDNEGRGKVYLLYLVIRSQITL